MEAGMMRVKQHLMDNHAELGRQCPSCPDMFFSERLLSEHMLLNHTDKSRSGFIFEQRNTRNSLFIYGNPNRQLPMLPVVPKSKSQSLACCQKLEKKGCQTKLLT